MPRRVKTSRTVFRDRLDFLVDRSSVREVAQFYGVTDRTVRRWIQEETTPSQRIRESVRRRGRRAGARRAVQLRENGRFTTAADDGTRSVRVGIVRQRRRSRAAAIANAQATGNEAALRIARRMRVNLTEEEINNLTYRRIALQEGQAEESWTNWRMDYEIFAAGGGI